MSACQPSQQRHDNITSFSGCTINRIQSAAFSSTDSPPIKEYRQGFIQLRVCVFDSCLAHTKATKHSRNLPAFPAEHSSPSLTEPIYGHMLPQTPPSADSYTPRNKFVCVPRRLPYGVSVVLLPLKLPWFIGMAGRYCDSPSTALLWHYMTSSQPVTCTLTWSQQRDHGEGERSARFRLYSNIWSRLVLRACRRKNKQQSRGLSLPRPCYPYTIMMKCNCSMAVMSSHNIISSSHHVERNFNEIHNMSHDQLTIRACVTYIWGKIKRLVLKPHWETNGTIIYKMGLMLIHKDLKLSLVKVCFLCSTAPD